MKQTPATIPQALQDALQGMPACASALVGLSGGLDSVVLLHALVQLREQGLLPFQLRAIHVHHGLHPDADHWLAQCQAQCQARGVACVSSRLALGSQLTTGGDKPPAGLENAARRGRYAAFETALADGEALLLAHHRDDQIETLLLRLLRGAGPKGLSGMPRQRPLGNGFLYRPLLALDRATLHAYALQHGLTWIDDEANALQHFDRNYCRHTVLPAIAARWPGYRESLSKSLVLQAEADALLQEMAAADLQLLQESAANSLALDRLLALSEPRQRNVLRHWLVTLGLPEPGWHELQHLTTALVPAAADATAAWQGSGYTVARYRKQLVARRASNSFDPAVILEWDPRAQASYSLPDNGRLVARPSAHTERDRKLAVAVTGPLQVRYRAGGETCRLRGRPGKALKKILQEQGVAPWLRERLPLIYAGTALISVPGIGATEATALSADADLLVIEWQPPDLSPVPL